MSNSARTDLMRWDQEVDEPYMLIPRFPDLRLTPWREGEDIEASVQLFNEPNVARYSFRRPYPYLPEHLDTRRQHMLPFAAQTIETVLRPLLRSSSSSRPIHPLPVPTGPLPLFPLINIRHHPSGKMIGEIQLMQSPSDSSNSVKDQSTDLVDQGSTTVAVSEQTLELVYNLGSEWTGKGIAGAVLDVVLEGWVRWLGIGTVIAGAETANLGSAGLVKSRGFVKYKTYMETFPEDKGGDQREISYYALKMANYKSRPLEG